MPFVFIFVGLVFVVSGSLGTSNDLLTRLKGDLTGERNFFYWILAIFIIGALGYVQDLRAFSRAFLALVLIVLVIQEGKEDGTGGGFFTKFQDAVSTITKTKAA